METDPQGAIPDFERAVAHGTLAVTPYLYLAHHYLMEGRFERCIELCDRILSLTQKPQTQATALQWAAIARLELYGPSDDARQMFVKALELDPENRDIARNYALFQQLEQSGSALMSQNDRSQKKSHQSAFDTEQSGSALTRQTVHWHLTDRAALNDLLPDSRELLGTLRAA